MRHRRVCLTAFLCAACIRCAGPGPAAAPAIPTATAPGAILLREQRIAMGTEVEITLWAVPSTSAEEAVDAAYAEMLRLEERMTSWTHPGWPQSDVARINARAGDGTCVPVAPETLAVLTLGAQVSQASRGAFDMTYAPLRDVWHFDEDARETVPEPDAVKAQQALVGFADLELPTGGCGARLRRPGMRIDLGGIAKGAIVDAAVAVLRKHGYDDFIVRAGGDMYVAGQPGARPWRVGIQDPRRHETPLALLELRDHAFSTSGDYERGFVQGGRRYHHILDPRTGYPAGASRSVTIYAPSAVLADALDNAVFVSGAEAGMALLRQYPGCEAVIVDADNHLHVTPGLRSRLRVTGRAD